MSHLPNQDEFIKREKVDSCERCHVHYTDARYECEVCSTKYCEFCAENRSYKCFCSPELIPLEK